MGHNKTGLNNPLLPHKLRPRSLRIACWSRAAAIFVVAQGCAGHAQPPHHRSILMPSFQHLASGTSGASRAKQGNVHAFYRPLDASRRSPTDLDARYDNNRPVDFCCAPSEERPCLYGAKLSSGAARLKVKICSTCAGRVRKAVGYLHDLVSRAGVSSFLD